MSVQHPAHRGSICLEDGKVLAQQTFPGDQFVIRIEAPKCAARALPGSFAHLTVDDDIPMRRPLSIMRVDAHAGWIEILYKIVGPGLAALARRRVGDVLSVLGPIGRGFEPTPAKPRPLLIGGGVGIPPMVFLAEALSTDARASWQPLVLMGSEIPFPFQSRPSTILVPGIPPGVIAAMPLLDAWSIPSRLTPMLEATAKLAARFGLPCQVSLEEFMACAVGGCAGCAVRVKTATGPAMKRVCVDGPVFDGYAVFDV